MWQDGAGDEEIQKALINIQRKFKDLWKVEGRGQQLQGGGRDAELRATRLQLGVLPALPRGGDCRGA